MELEHELNRENVGNAGGTVEKINLDFAGLTASQIAAIDDAAERTERSDKAIDNALRLCNVESFEQLQALEEKFAENGLLPVNSKGEVLKARSLFAKGGAWKPETLEHVDEGRRRKIQKIGKNNRILAEADYNVALFCARAEQRLLNRSRAAKDPEAPDWGKGAIFDRLQAIAAMLVFVLPDDNQNKPTMDKGRQALKEMLEHFQPKR